MPDKTIVQRFYGKTKRAENGCLEWTACRNKNGYGQIRVGGRAGGAELAHRVAWELVHGPVPDGMCVLHRCDNPPCVWEPHLFLGTQMDNIADMRAKKRAAAPPHPRGSSASYAKLTEVDIPRIRRRSAEGETMYALAAEFGVSKSTVSNIVRRKSWRHVT